MPILQALERNRSELRRQETQTLANLVSAYQRVVESLQTEIALLNAQIAVLDARGELTVNKVRQLAVYGSFLEQVDDRLQAYGIVADNELRQSASRAIDTATVHSRRLTREYFTINPNLQRAFDVTWDILPSESIETLLGFLRPDSRLTAKLTSDLGSFGAQYMSDQLLEGIALGYNPRKIASTISRSLGVPLTYSLTNVRTAQLWSYREATRLNYINNSEIVQKWTWYASLDGRVCLSCVNQHGREYSLTVPLNDHHNGRCAQLPILRDFPVNIQSGQDWFNNLPASEQQRRMGPAMYQAYRNGEFQFQELSKVYENDVYGEMLQQNSLRGMIGDNARKYYTPT